ncbi:MAG: hypothetical protein NE328_17460 [Lentisphaeraceae bacterium]|nr:hypothetical protein [Lentisphaeraceae bacterium]
MNGLGKIANRSRGSRGGRSVSIYESIRIARILMGHTNPKSRTTILQKDWQRKDIHKKDSQE